MVRLKNCAAILALVLFSLISAARAEAPSTNEGIQLFMEGKFQEAESSLKKSLRENPNEPEALEYLALLRERVGRYEEALKLWMLAKAVALPTRHGDYNFRIGNAYFKMKNYPRAALYLRLAADSGAFPVQAPYLLGLLHFELGNYYDAEEWFYKAKVAAKRKEAKAEDRDLLQPTEFYLGDIYARNGYIESASVALQDAESGESVEVRQSAWRLHSSIDHPRVRIFAGVAGQLDSNPVQTAIDAWVPQRVYNTSSLVSLWDLRLGWESSPVKRFSYGIEGAFFARLHQDTVARGNDLAVPGLIPFVGYWNRKAVSVRASLPLKRSYFRGAQTSLHLFQDSYGPRIEVNVNPYRRWNFQAAFEYLKRSFYNEGFNAADFKSGELFRTTLRADVRSINPRFQPWIEFSFESDRALGSSWVNTGERAEVGASWRWFERTRVQAEFGVGYWSFPEDVLKREDVLVYGGAGVTQGVGDFWRLEFKVSTAQNSSELQVYTYNRTLFTLGASYQF